MALRPSGAGPEMLLDPDREWRMHPASTGQGLRSLDESTLAGQSRRRA
jgi:hypothetical protein